MRPCKINVNTFNFRVFNKDLIGLTNYGDGRKAYARVAQPGVNETFMIVRNAQNPFRVRIRAPNGLFLHSPTRNSVKAEYGGSPDDWSDGNPSVFVMTIYSQHHGW